MFRKKKSIFLVTLILFFVTELFLLKNNQFQVGIFIYLLYTLFLYIVDPNYVIQFFVFNLPLTPIISSDYKLFSLIGPHEIIYGFSFIVLYGASKKVKLPINKYQKLSIAFVNFLFFINMYIIIKDTFFELNPKYTGLFYILKNFIRYFLYYMSLNLLIKAIYRKEILNSIYEGIKYSVVFLVISMIFTKQLILMGADIANKEIYFTRLDMQNRYIGFYGAGGDQNSVGVFLAGVFGFFLALYDKTGNIKRYILYLGLSLLGILLTGSRSAFMALSLILLIFLFTNKSGSSKLYILISIILFYFIFNKQLNLVLQRFLDPDTVGAIDPKSDGRVFKWIYYTEWMLNNPKTFILGNQSKIPFKIAPHNYFIYIVYHTGLIVLFVFVNLLIKLLKMIRFKLTRNSLKSAYYILPFPFALMTVNSFGSSIYLWLYLPIGAFYLMSNSNKVLT